MTAPVQPTNPSNLFTPFLPATFNIPEEDDRGRVFLNDKLSAISDVVNDKKIGAYTVGVENFGGEKWAYITTEKIRNQYQTFAYIPSYPAAAGNLVIPNPIPNVTPQLVITFMMGTASKPCSATGAGDGDYFSFVNAGNPNISFVVSDTTITITNLTGVDLSPYSGFIIIHYLRDGF